jgi:hypothetical protein
VLEIAAQFAAEDARAATGDKAEVHVIAEAARSATVTSVKRDCRRRSDTLGTIR